MSSFSGANIHEYCIDLNATDHFITDLFVFYVKLYIIYE